MNDRDIQDVFNETVKPMMNAGRAHVIGIVLIIAILIAGFQSFFTVKPEEEAVILRFGKYSRIVGPGLHFKVPFWIEQAYFVPVQRQLKKEFGFRTLQADVRSTYQKRGYEGESLMLTGDLNSADVEWVVQYRITEPLEYLFNVRSVEDTFRDMSEAVMRRVVGDRSVDEVITWGKSEINQEVKEQLQELADQYGCGLTVQVVLLQDVNAPPPVQPSWNEVNEAEQEKDKLINQAKSTYNQRVPKARGEAQQMISEAEGYAIQRVNEADGRAQKFTDIYTEYREAPHVTRRRYYLETMRDILPKAGQKFVVTESEANILKLMDLDRPEGGSR